MGVQNGKSPNFGNFETPTWESEKKCHLGVSPVTKHRVYYKGEGGGFPQVRAMVSLVSSNLSEFVLTPKMFHLCTNQLV
jgi:hypothetical protein